MGKIWAVCSGCGGVGKTMIAVSLAVGAAKAGKKTILLDACGSARSADLLLGLESLVTLDLMDVFSRQAGIQSALYPVVQYEGLQFCCASLHESVPAAELSGMILALHSLCDILVIDLPTGQYSLGRGVMRRGDERLYVLRPDSACIRAAEQLMMHTMDDPASDSLVINRSDRHQIRRKTQYTQDTVQSLLDRMALACIPEDASIADAQLKGKAAIECSGPAWTALRSLTQELLGSA